MINIITFYSEGKAICNCPVKNDDDQFTIIRRGRGQRVTIEIIIGENDDNDGGLLGCNLYNSHVLCLY